MKSVTMGNAEIQESFKIREWRKHLAAEGCTVSSVIPLQTISKKNGEPLFSLLDTKIISPEGHRMPNIIFIRGNAVITVPHVRNSDTGEERFLMIRQRRIGNGQLCLEFPAGMIDRADDDPAEVAIRELLEETGLSIKKESLEQLCPSPLFSSPGASDEAIFYFGCRITLNNDEYTMLSQRIGGNHAEDEFCFVQMLSREEAEPHLTSLQAKLAIRLFTEHFCSK